MALIETRNIAIYPANSPNEATFNKIIQSMIDDGTLKRLAHKYLTEAWGQDPTQIPFSQTVSIDRWRTFGR